MKGKSNNCKVFHNEPYMTPNNFDLYFDYNSVPANIVAESPYDLKKRLQGLMPLGKIIHLNMEVDSLNNKSNMKLSTNMNLKFMDNDKLIVKEVKII